VRGITIVEAIHIYNCSLLLCADIHTAAMNSHTAGQPASTNGQALRRFASSLQGSQFTVQLPGEATPHRNHYFALLFAILSPDLIGNIPSSHSTLMSCENLQLSS
jgi:hypothetical protein